MTARTKKYRAPTLEPEAREHLVAAIIKYLVKPGLITAAEIMIDNMAIKKDVRTAESVVSLAKEMALRGFPTKDEKDAAAQLAAILQQARAEGEYEDEDVDGEAEGSGAPDPDAGGEAGDLGQGTA